MIFGVPLPLCYNQENGNLYYFYIDLTRREFVILTSLFIVNIFLGINPNFFIYEINKFVAFNVVTFI